MLTMRMQEKRSRAQALLREHISESRAVISTQVIQEFFVTATRKLGVPADIARKKVELLLHLDVILIRPELIIRRLIYTACTTFPFGMRSSSAPLLWPDAPAC